MIRPGGQGMGAEGGTRLVHRLLLLSLVAFLIVSRAVFWTAHPPNFDFVNFALGVEHFSPIDHQPHPPGYPLLIALAKILAALGAGVVPALQWASLAGAIAAIVGAYRLGRRLAGEAGGLFSALLLALHPICWFSGVSSPTRVYLAAGACWLLAGCLEMGRGDRRWLWRTAALLAVCAGFRPEFLVLFPVPCIVAARLGGASWKRVLRAALFCLLLCALWVSWVVAGFGSFYKAGYIYFYYFLHHAGTTSPFLHAPPHIWSATLLYGLWWNGLLLPVLAVALLLARRKAALERAFWLPAMLYFLPALAIQLVIHMGLDCPDHALGTIAVLCVVAGAWLGKARPRVAAAATALAAAAAFVFVALTPSSTGIAALDVPSLPAFARAQAEQAKYLETVEGALRPGDGVLVLSDSLLSFRLVAWEAPQARVMTLFTPVSAAPASPPIPCCLYTDHERSTLPGGALDLRGLRRLVVVSSPNSPQLQFVSGALCGGRDCRLDSWIAVVDLTPAALPPSLPPYRVLN